jgi:hypothetical protein
MSQTVSSPKPPSRLKRLLRGMTDDPNQRPARRPGGAPAPVETEYRVRNRLLPAFWTVASILSLIVNVVLIGILLSLWMRPYDQFSGILGGLYNNFVKMDQATISANVPVQQSIPLNINVPVTIPTVTADITLTKPAEITNVGVQITEGGVTINALAAKVTLPVGTPLSVEIKNMPPFNLPVQDQIPISLNIPVNIPLSQTQLHEPFVGLQEVVRPYYCLLEPNAMVNGILVCSPLASPVIQLTPTLPVIP